MVRPVIQRWAQRHEKRQRPAEEGSFLRGSGPWSLLSLRTLTPNPSPIAMGEGSRIL
jgi:hypothetical protein